MKQLLAFIFSILLTGNVWAADNSVIVTPGTGVTIRSKDVGAGVESMIQILGDTSGNALATAPGTPNSVFALPIQGVTSGTPVPISGSLTNISGTISLPTGAATSALQTTGNTALTTINATLGTPMQNSGGSVGITAASGSIASGAVASGAVASGAYASGAFASGAAASGSWADGSLVTVGAKADAKSTATDTTAITLMQVAKEQSFALQNPTTASITNPTSTLTLPSTTTAYTVGTLICSSATVGTCNTTLASTSFAIGNSAGAANISRLRLTTNDATSTAWGTQTVQIDLWSAAPVFATTGDRGSFTTDFSTGSAGHLGAFTCLMSAELADGAYSECFPSVGNSVQIKLASGTAVFWTAQAVTGSGVTGASKVFTLTAELAN